MLPCGRTQAECLEAKRGLSTIALNMFGFVMFYLHIQVNVTHRQECENIYIHIEIEKTKKERGEKLTINIM